MFDLCSMILLKLNKQDLCTLVVRVATLLLVTRNLVSKINTSSIRAVIGSCEWWWSDSKKKTVVHTKRCLIDNTFQMLQKHFFFETNTTQAHVPFGHCSPFIWLENLISDKKNRDAPLSHCGRKFGDID